LRQAWSQGPEAYLGVATKDMPNFFMLYGPNTNLGHTSILFMVERQIDYILRLLKEMQGRGAGEITVRAEAQDRYNKVLQAVLKQSPWASDCGSWYKTESGKITNNWPHSTQDYANALKRVEWGHWAMN
jgi:cation diffusion facilitator CzcD-associated flavoprotein CzcO